jgi:hypothetical protein
LFISYTLIDDIVVGKYNLDGTVINPALIGPAGPDAFDIAISGTDLFTGSVDTVNKYTTSGMVVAEPLITTSVGDIAVDGPATVPETLSPLWFGLTIAGLLGLSRLLRVRHEHSLPERAMTPSLSEVA